MTLRHRLRYEVSWEGISLFAGMYLAIWSMVFVGWWGYIIMAAWLVAWWPLMNRLSPWWTVPMQASERPVRHTCPCCGQMVNRRIRRVT